LKTAPTAAAELFIQKENALLMRYKNYIIRNKYYLLIYSMEQNLFQKLAGSQLVKKFPAFYRT